MGLIITIWINQTLITYAQYNSGFINTAEINLMHIYN